jgi:hypothetical protein
MQQERKRISQAALSALNQSLDSGGYGVFTIEHDDGTVTISRSIGGTVVERREYPGSNQTQITNPQLNRG